MHSCPLLLVDYAHLKTVSNRILFPIFCNVAHTNVHQRRFEPVKLHNLHHHHHLTFDMITYPCHSSANHYCNLAYKSLQSSCLDFIPFQYNVQNVHFTYLPTINPNQTCFQVNMTRICIYLQTQNCTDARLSSHYKSSCCLKKKQSRTLSFQTSRRHLVARHSRLLANAKIDYVLH